MTPSAMAYEPRSICFLDLWETDGWRLKVYGISHDRESPRKDLVQAAKAAAGRFLRDDRTSHDIYGVGFLGVHEGRTGNQVFIDRWANENELLHEIFVSPTDDPTRLTPPPQGHNSVCVWDLALQAFEREAWLECVLGNPGGPDLEAYLARRCDRVV